MKRLLILAVLLATTAARAAETGDYLVKMNADEDQVQNLKAMLPTNSLVENLGVSGWYHVKVAEHSVGIFSTHSLLANPLVTKVESNQTIRPYWSPDLDAARAVAQTLGVQKMLQGVGPDAGGPTPRDNPPFPTAGSGGSGPDPQFNNQWGMNQIGVKAGWEKSKGSPEMVVAVIDTGVDYTHEDLVDNMWHNSGEMGRDAQGRDKSSNGVDDDGNGYIDDLVGWDFAGNDNKPYDMWSTFEQIISGEGNPGHGTHCAGNVGARGENGKGIAGVAPNIRIMAIRFITEKGSGTTADAIKAVRYAVSNGAKVLSNSWGSEGDDPKDPDTQALKDAIRFAQDHGVLFVAAAGNGHQGRGYDNDSDSRPGVPASYSNDNIISVAALDSRGNLGSFSNWGRNSVDLAAPGVKVYSTVPANRYQDTIGSFFGQQITWDGTSMATPHVAGAAALYWSAHPEKSWLEVKSAILSSVKKLGNLSSKVVSGGTLDVRNLMAQ